MKATEAKLLDFIRKSPQFLIPIYQRTYSWTEKECKQLWNDIVRAGSNDSITAHFIGSIVYIEKGLYQVSNQSSLLVIDGQQRLTTITLLLLALTQYMEKLPEDEQEIYDGFSPIKIKDYYLQNHLEKGERHYKLILSQTDKETLIAAVSGKSYSGEISLAISENLNKFTEWVFLAKEQIENICKGITKLMVVDISLNRDQDNPQLIFESMNSTGRELTQADLIRNYILMGLDEDMQSRLYNEYWRPMEQEFGQQAYGTQFDSFMRHYLTVKTGDIPRIKEVYESFKKYSNQPVNTDKGVEEIVVDIQKFASYFCSIALGDEVDKEMNKAFHDLRELRVDVVYPLLLEMYKDYKEEIINKECFLKIIRLIESYVFRRAVCAIPTNSLNKTFANFTKSINKENYFESFQAHLLLLPSYRRFPRDEEFIRELMHRDLYNFPRRSYWLRRLENYNRKELVHIDEYTIEHILPQNETLSKEWKEALGPDWERIRETYLHTVGNLTLTRYNSEYSDKPYPLKRDMEGGFRVSPLHLNQGLGQLENWNKNTIVNRAKRLSSLAVIVWSIPILSSGVIELYRPQNGKKVCYTLNDHPFLDRESSSFKNAIYDLFIIFREKVLEIDPVINEEILKLYIAYKAETNFVDVVPQASVLRLSINIPFQDITDVKGICKDVSKLGRWGNGDVEVRLKHEDEIPYVITLVRQAFEWQMGTIED